MNKIKIIFSIVFSIFFVLSISTYYNTIKQNEYIQKRQKQTFNTFQQMIDGKIIFFRKQFHGRLKNIIKHNKEFKQAIISNDTRKIKAIMDELFKVLKRENRYAKVLHLISNDNISIYRAHNSNSLHDDLTNIRPIVKYVNQHKKTRYGFEVGLHSIVYRVDIPIKYNGKYYGLLEYGVDSDMFINDFISVSDYVRSITLANKKNINGNNKFIPIQQNDVFFKNFNISMLQDTKYFTYQDKAYKILIYNLYDFDASITGKIVLAINTTFDKHFYQHLITTSIINQILLIIIIFLIVDYAFNYYEKKINELIEHERENERMLHQQSKMAAMGEMIGNIAHQWRQPLSAISTIASGIMVQKEYGMFNEDRLIPSMKNITEQTKYLSTTIDDFKNFFSSDKIKQRFKISDVIAKNISLVKDSFKSHQIEIIKEVDDTIELEGYKNELMQAILNILNNAKDQLIKLKSNEPKLIYITAKKENTNIIIEIIDNAGGIDTKIISKIFEPYFTTKHQAQGTGIGLYMTHEIIFKHFKGTIVATNTTTNYQGNIYNGAKFIITLPILQNK
jgi:signal transduction histidine kinase